MGDPRKGDEVTRYALKTPDGQFVVIGAHAPFFTNREASAQTWPTMTEAALAAMQHGIDAEVFQMQR
jgi:hypothetical protein